MLSLSLSLSLNDVPHLAIGTYTVDQSSTDNVTAIVGGLIGGLIVLILVIGSITVLIIILSLRRKGIVHSYGIIIIVMQTIIV